MVNISNDWYKADIISPECGDKHLRFNVNCIDKKSRLQLTLLQSVLNEPLTHNINTMLLY